eukprot:752763-Hanusia_phi.AAC.3
MASGCGESKEEGRRWLRVVHITDFHVLKDASSMLSSGILPYESLRSVVYHAQTVCCEPDAVLMTGDFTHDDSIEAYEMIGELIKEVWDTRKVPVLYVPGNHDHVDRMSDVFRGNGMIGSNGPGRPSTFRIGSWSFLMVSTHVEGQIYGRIDDGDLRWIEEQLSERRDEHCLLALHHPPRAPEPRTQENLWTENCLRNGEDLLNILSDKNCVKLVLHGHLHSCTRFSVSANCLQVGAPATCHQYDPTKGWKPGPCRFDPGCRSLGVIWPLQRFSLRKPLRLGNILPFRPELGTVPSLPGGDRLRDRRAAVTVPGPAYPVSTVPGRHISKLLYRIRYRIRRTARRAGTVFPGPPANAPSQRQRAAVRRGPNRDTVLRGRAGPMAVSGLG